MLIQTAGDSVDKVDWFWLWGLWAIALAPDKVHVNCVYTLVTGAPGWKGLGIRERERFMGQGGGVLLPCLVASGQESESESCSVVSDCLWHHGLYSPWNSPDQNTGVGSLSLLQGIFPTQGSNPGLPPCRWIFFYQMSHKGSPVFRTCAVIFWHTFLRTRAWWTWKCFVPRGLASLSYVSWYLSLISHSLVYISFEKVTVPLERSISRKRHE